MAESFWATLKVEYYYHHALRICEKVYEGGATWIEGLYNHKRIHSAIGYQSTVEYELHTHMNQAARTTQPGRQQLADKPKDNTASAA